LNGEDVFRLMEPLDDVVWRTPASRLRAVKRSLGVDNTTKGSFLRVTEDNLIELLQRHVGPEDVPVYSTEHFEGFVANVMFFLKAFDKGQEVYQYEVEWAPEWLKEFRGDYLPDPPTNWLSVERVKAIKGISDRTIKEYCSNGILTATKCRGNVWYVRPDIKFDYWITNIPGYGALYRRLKIIKKLLSKVEVGTNLELYRSVESYEQANPKIKLRGMYDKYPVEKFMSRAMGAREPKLISEWRDKIDALIEWAREERKDEYGIN
jgi:hypothetical protein